MTQETATLFLLDELSRETKRPVQLNDFLSYVRLALQMNALRNQDAEGLRWSDASDLFALLHDLEAEGSVLRRPRGFVMTPKGRRRARTLRKGLPLDVLRDVEEAAKVA